MNDTPTQRLYSMLDRAYDELNESLFGGELPRCLITLQRKKGSYGYFCHERFSHEKKSKEDKPLDEIALNPQHFLVRDRDVTLSTLAHEMAHLWQHHFGKPSKSVHHNREWADKMKSIGLQPVGANGKETGRRVSHTIDPEGKFAEAVKPVLTFFNPLPGDVPTSSMPSTKSGRYAKYICTECGTKAQAKPGLDLRCGDHGPMFERS